MFLLGFSSAHPRLMLLFSLSGAIIGTAKMAGLLQEDGGVRGSTAVYMSAGYKRATSRESMYHLFVGLYRSLEYFVWDGFRDGSPLKQTTAVAFFFFFKELRVIKRQALPTRAL